MSDLKTPERRATEKKVHQPEPVAEKSKTPSQEVQPPPGHLTLEQGNIDIITAKLLESMNRKLMTLLEMLDSRLPKKEESKKE